MKISKTLEKAINEQIKNEFDNSFLYLSIASWCEANDFYGFAEWNKKQFEEEQQHGLKFYNYLFERGGKVEVKEVEKPQQNWKNILNVYEDILKREQETTKHIYKLYDLAKKENDYMTMNLLNWFVEEQVEEESNASTMIAKIKMAEKDISAIMLVDKEAGKRE